MSKTKKFGGMYNHEVIKELRSEIAKKGIVLSALVEHYKTPQEELQKIVDAYILKMESLVRQGQS